jgi:hypothetical protein
MIAYLEVNRFPHNSVEADSDFRDLQCQLFNKIISDSVLFNKDSKFIVVSSFPTNFSDTFTKLIVTSMLGRSNQSLPNDDFQLVVKLIVDSSSEGAQISKLIVNYILIPSSEGARRAASKLTVDFVVHHELIELINGFVSHIELTELISRVLDGHMNYFQQGATSHFNDACVHRLIVVSVSEGARQVAPAQLAASSTILKLIDALISEGARFDSNLYQPGNLDSSQLIVYIISVKRASQLIVIYSKKFLHFREDCDIICEGEWEEQSQQPKHDLPISSI